MGIQVLKRKSHLGTSLSEDFDHDSGACTVEYFWALKDPFRASPGNKISVAWPYDMTIGSDTADKIVNHIKSSYDKVLRDCGIQLHQERVQGLSPKGLFQFRDTLILETHDENYHKWKAAATLIQEILDKEIEKQSAKIKIRVEIRNEEKMYRDTSSIIKPNTTAHKACLQAENAVYEQVQKSCPGLWTTISYHMRGPRWQTDFRKPTLMVAVAPGSRSIWATVEDQIQSALESIDSLEVEMHVEILPGCPLSLLSQDTMPSEPFIFRDLPEPPLNGSSIGARENKIEAGSLGAFVYFQPPGNAEKQKCFLTCHHVISPTDPAHKGIVDIYGIGLHGCKTEMHIKVDYPAPFDAAKTKQVLQSEIAQGKDADGNKARTLEILDKHVSAGGIRSVIYASGLRNNSIGRRMDWALVSLNNSDPIEQNKPPPANFSGFELLNRKLEYKVGPDEVVSKCGTLVKGDWAAKNGRTTGITVGEVNSMEAVVDWKNGTVSKEIEIVALVGGQGFVMGGDSGAMVFNIKKEWVGMAMGMFSHDNYGYITPVKELMDDIEATTGGTISLT